MSAEARPADLVGALGDVAAALERRDHDAAAQASVRLQTLCGLLARQELDADTLRAAGDLLQRCQDAAAREQATLAASLLQSGQSNKAHVAYRRR
jgi:hypothetical protein